MADKELVQTSFRVNRDELATLKTWAIRNKMSAEKLLQQVIRNWEQIDHLIEPAN
jgi:hypothetical protein